MQNKESELSPAESELLQKLQALEQLSYDLVQKLDHLEQDLCAKDDEISVVRRNAIELQKENQRLREQLQTWRERMQLALSQLTNID